MRAAKQSDSGWQKRVRRGLRYLKPRRGVAVIVGIHLLAFVVLYLSVIRLVEREIALAHEAEVRDVALRALGVIHPALAEGDDMAVRNAVEEARRKYELLELEFRDREGWPVVPGGGDVPLFASHRSELAGVLDLEAQHAGGRWTLAGVVPVVASAHCGPCHQEGEDLGQVVARMDLSAHVAAPRSRLQRNARILVVAWALGLGLLNVTARRVATLRLRSFRADLRSGDEPTSPAFARVLPATLDPVSAEMYESLLGALRQVSEREERVTARIHHTERLASLGQIAAGLAHEIKNPLSGIRGALELMRDEAREEGSGRAELHEQMIHEMDRVHEILHSLLRFARPSPAHKVSVNVRELLDDCAGLMAHGLRRKGIALEVQVAPEVGEHPMDAAQIRQVLVNLVNNAAEAIGKGGSIVVRATAFPAGEGLIVSVEDDGPGMSEEQLENIFQPFFTTKFSGTGLGLAVSRGIVMEHGGSLEVKSSPGEGATFFLLFPDLGDNDAATPESEAASGAEPIREETRPWP